MRGLLKVKCKLLHKGEMEPCEMEMLGLDCFVLFVLEIKPRLVCMLGKRCNMSHTLRFRFGSLKNVRERQKQQQQNIREVLKVFFQK